MWMTVLKIVAPLAGFGLGWLFSYYIGCKGG